jgi:hypothetical protein
MSSGQTASCKNKKPYHKPTLKVHGAMTVLTGTGITMGTLNDHNQGTNKTS